MKNLLFAPLIIATFSITSAAQVKSVAAANNQTTSNASATSPNSATGSRVRVLRHETPIAPQANFNNSTPQTVAKTELNNHIDSSRVRRTNQPERIERNTQSAPEIGSIREKRITSATAVISAGSNVAPTPSNVLMASTQIYRIGPKDVLDIQLSGNPSRKSTLFTVLDGGLLEYPLAGDPIPVAGMTAAEVAAVLRQRIRIFEHPSVVVNVRDYASHSVTITGFVAAPGTKALRREAVPLYAMLAEAVALPEAARATITRQGRPTMTLDLKDPNHSSTLVVPGDVIKVLGTGPAPSEFYFVGSGLNSPGQKPYHQGITLTQAVLASGGVRMSGGSKLRVSRQRADGRLVNEDFDLRKIQNGKVPDPVLEKGDRIEAIGTN